MRRALQSACVWLVAALACAGAATAADIAKVGILFPDTREARAPMMAAFEARLQALGYRLGTDLRLDARYANGDSVQLAHEARELADSDASVIVAAGTAPAEAMQRVARSKPILFIAVGDPVARGFVADLHAPNRNMTGSSDLLPDAPQRRFALIAEVLPAAKSVAVISNPAITVRGPLDRHAAALGLSVTHLDVRSAEDFAAVYAALGTNPPDALLVTPNPTTFTERRRLADFCRERRIATLFGWREFMDAGGLMSLGANMENLYVAAAGQLDRLMKGVPVSQIPVESPQFDLVVDLRTARALGVSIPRAVLERANRVIE